MNIWGSGGQGIGDLNILPIFFILPARNPVPLRMTPFFNDFKDAKKYFFLHIFLKTCPQAHHLQSKNLNFLLKFCDKMIFCRHYISPLNTFMRKGKDPRSRIRVDQKHGDPADPVPDPQHWFQQSLVWLYLVPKDGSTPLNNITYCCSIFLSVMLDGRLLRQSPQGGSTHCAVGFNDLDFFLKIKSFMLITIFVEFFYTFFN